MADFSMLNNMIAEARKAKEERAARREAIEKALMNGPNAERVNQWQEMMDRSVFIDSDHPRDEKGRFTEKGLTDISSNSSCDRMSKENIYRQRGRRQRKEIRLDKREYARVMHELNTNLTKEERMKRIISRHIGNYVYTVENQGFNEYRIIEREKI